jgi:hypothetical protein
MTINTIKLSTAVDTISCSLFTRSVTIGWASGFRATYYARRRDQLRALSAYAFCQPFSFGAWANQIKYNCPVTIDQLNTIG